MGFGSDWKKYIDSNDEKVVADTGARSTKQKSELRSKKQKAIESMREDQVALLRTICEKRNLPEPVDEHEFHPERKWRFDYAWPDVKVALEVQGGIWTRGGHTRGKGYMNDMEKFNEAQLHGWVVLQCTPDEVYGRDTIDLIERAIERRSR